MYTRAAVGWCAEQEAKRMPILNDILDHEVLGREFKKGLAEGVQQGIEQGVRQGIEQGVRQGIEQGVQQGIERGVQQGIERGVQQGIERGVQQEAWHMLRRLIEKRFGTMPMWAAEKLAKRSVGELEELSMRLLDVQSIEELLR
jgi:flagellar biosynthesis/type III secretory pathway protein FliH